MKLFIIFLMGFLFLINPNWVNADSHISFTEEDALKCETPEFIDGPDGTKIQKCQIGFTVSGEPTKNNNKLTIKFTLDKVSIQSITPVENWYMTQNTDSYIFETTQSSIPVGFQAVATVVFVKSKENANEKCEVDYEYQFEKIERRNHDKVTI